VSDHIPDPTKMIQDTPRTDEQINGKPCTRFEILAGDSLRNAAVPSEFARTIERELNAAQQRIKRLEEDLMDAKNQHAVLAADVVLYEDRGERIKRLEDIISRAKNKFFRHGSNGTAASGMLDILGEVRKP
jgi:hypothetical protein